MSTKEEVLQYISMLGEKKVVTKDELIQAFDSVNGDQTDATLHKKLAVTEILYYIGAAIVFLGIVILLWQNWTMLGTATRILVTLGSGLAAYIVGLLFSRNTKTETVSSAFYLIFALVTPLGLSVTFDSAGFDVYSHGFQSLISALMLAAHLGSFFVFRKSIFIVFSILVATWLFFSFTSWLIGTTPLFSDWTFYMYRIFMASVAYMLIGYSFSKNQLAPLSGFLYGFGIFGFLSSALILGDWEPNQNIFWELIYPVLVFGALFASVHIKSKSFLTWGTIFLMLYILKITSAYFSSGLGWPLSLVIAGFAMIGIGYMSFTINKKYLKANQ